MDFLDLVNGMSAEELSELVDIAGATALVTTEMVEEEDPGAVTPEMTKLSEECASLGQQLSIKLLAFEEAKQRAAFRQTPSDGGAL